MGMGISISVALLLLYIKTKQKTKPFMRKHQSKHRQAIDSSEDNRLNRWITLTEKNIKEAGLKLNIVSYLALSAAFSVTAFVISMNLFKNITASMLLSASFFILPEHALNIINQKRQDKISQQMIVAIRVFTAEFIQTPQIERGFEVIGNRIGDPVGAMFRKAHMELVIGIDSDIVLSRLARHIDSEYGQMFVQLLKLAKGDSSTTPLFTDLLEKIENNIEINRKNKTNITGERTLAFLMTCIPLPAYLFMTRAIPETSYFLAETPVGRFIIIISFGSMLVWAILDRITGRVEA